MKLSVSLPDEDVDFLDEYTAAQGMDSRSAAVQKAIRLLRASELGPAYEAAWSEWDESGEGSLWDAALEDGLA
jgi:Arc/MetJ-type ribon-helix-helix transcriptional regulator